MMKVTASELADTTVFPVETYKSCQPSDCPSSRAPGTNSVVLDVGLNLLLP
jgi:hypothetical protein